MIYPPLPDRKSPNLIGLPFEVLDMVLAEGLTPFPNGTAPGVKYTFEDGVRRGGRPRRMGPLMTSMGLTNPQMRYAIGYIMYSGAVISILHDDVKKTVAFLAELYPGWLNSIRGLHIEYQREQPIDYDAFHRLCRIIKTMKSLDVLHLTIPINPAPIYNMDLEEPGLINALKWHRDNFTRQMTNEVRILKGCAWKNSRRARWVRDLLTIAGNVRIGSLTEFQLTTTPRRQGSRLKSWLENYMCEQKQVRDARIRQLQRESHWSTWFSLQGLATAIRELRI